MTKKGFQKHKEKSFIKKVLEDKKKKSVNDPDRLCNFQISLQYYNDDQPSKGTLLDWQNDGLLANALDVLKGFCQRPLQEQIDGNKFAMYNEFPPKDKTDFSFPENVPEDAHWARIHVNGSSVIVGHVVNNTFFIVFLDKNHRFWLTKRVTDN
ncbi:MAG: hypothetical protein MJZ33_14315 [Paludibacteraceae bacterium]|nr:hypothetical protein [Paludibacteraceae bacterium]